MPHMVLAHTAQIFITNSIKCQRGGDEKCTSAFNCAPFPPPHTTPICGPMSKKPWQRRKQLIIECNWLSLFACRHWWCCDSFSVVWRCAELSLKIKSSPESPAAARNHHRAVPSHRHQYRICAPPASR